MAKAEKVNYKEYGAGELSDLLDETRATYRKMKFNHSVTPIENINLIKQSRRLIARIETELTKRKNEQ